MLRVGKRCPGTELGQILSIGFWNGEKRSPKGGMLHAGVSFGSIEYLWLCTQSDSWRPWQYGRDFHPRVGFVSSHPINPGGHNITISFIDIDSYTVCVDARGQRCSSAGVPPATAKSIAIISSDGIILRPPSWVHSFLVCKQQQG